MYQVEPVLIQKVLICFKNGDSPAKICKEFGLSERNYCTILKKFPNQFEKAKNKRIMNQKKNKLKNIKPVLQSVPRPKKTKITDEERIKILERKLELQKKENDELKCLLEVAKEHLGKF